MLFRSEGQAEYEGFKFGIAQSEDYERSVRRHERSIARKAALDSTWRPLEQIGASEVWETADTPAAELLYAEAFTTVDYVARTFGEKALRPLLEGLADTPNDIDSVFRGLFGLSSAQLQDHVRQDIATKDAYEQSIDALIGWAKAMLALEDQSRVVGQDLNAYIARRTVMSPSDRVAALLSLQQRYGALEAKAAAVAVPSPASSTQAIYRQSFAALSHAVAGFLDFERTGSNASRLAGNAALDDAQRFGNAAHDFLLGLMRDNQIAANEVLGTA